MHIFFICTGIFWESPFYMSSTYKSGEMYISTPGTHLYLNLLHVNYLVNTSVLVAWTKKDETVKFYAINKKGYTIFAPIINTNKYKKYFMLGSIGKFYHYRDYQYFSWNTALDTTDKRQSVSWNDAADMCSSVGAVLPYFTSREEMDELLHLLSHSPLIPPLEAVFIGLKYNRKEVNYFMY